VNKTGGKWGREREGNTVSNIFNKQLNKIYVKTKSVDRLFHINVILSIDLSKGALMTNNVIIQQREKCAGRRTETKLARKR